MPFPLFLAHRSTGVRIVLFAVLFAVCLATARATVVPYTTPSLGPISPDFTLSVSGSSVPVYAFQRNNDKPDYYFAHFSFGGTVTVTVTSERPITAATVSPLALAIPTTVSANTVSFPLSQSRYLIVKVDGLKELVIAADPLETNVPAASGNGIYNVNSYGADGTGAESSTKAFSDAIKAAAGHAGGGTVYVPDGLYTVGNLVIESNVTLYLSGGAVVQASRNRQDFTVKFFITKPGNGKTGQGEDGTWFISTAPNAANVTIRGRGVIDGTGTYLTDHENLLDDLIVPLGATHFTLDGIVGWDAGFWALIPTQCNDVKILNYKGMQSMTTFQNDGIDLNESQNVLVQHVIVASRDDCYSTKTWGPNGIGKNWPKAPQATSNALFQDVVAWTTDGAFKIGQGNYESHNNITFDHGYVYGAHWACYLKPNLPTDPAKAATVDGITFSNIDVETGAPGRSRNRFTWFYVEMPAAPVNNLTLRNINVRYQGEAPKIITAPSGSIHQLRLENVTVAGKKVGGWSDVGFDPSSVNLTEASFVP